MQIISKPKIFGKFDLIVFGVQYHIMTPPNPRPGRGRPPIMHSTILRDIIDAKHYSLLRGPEG